MSKYRKYKPYIRKGKKKDVGNDLRTNFRVAFLRTYSKKFYVLVQHGTDGVIFAAKSKKEVKEYILGDFKNFQNKVKHWAQKLR